MANAQAASATGRQYWTVPILRAVVALVPAVVITFNANHSAEFGLLAFGSFALLSGVLLVVLGPRTLPDRRDRTLFAVQGGVGVVAGVLALVMHAGGLGFFLYLVSVWGAVTGFLELYSGVRVRGHAASARDWMLVGGFTAVLALAFLLLPPHAVVSVGLLGAYLVMLGVYLVIAGLSLKWATAPDTRHVASAANDSDTQ
ncbi:MAG TPA: DUF308 domain-containing protein [Cryobacterium sp.]|nr:DUF308 domain-containing protein [Cryobacterium sp.]